MPGLKVTWQRRRGSHIRLNAIPSRRITGACVNKALAQPVDGMRNLAGSVDHGFPTIAHFEACSAGGNFTDGAIPTDNTTQHQVVCGNGC